MLALTTTDYKGVENMATKPLDGGGDPVTLPPALPSLPTVANILARHDRDRLVVFVTVAIDLIDAMDGDADAEPGTWLESLDARASDRGLPDDSEDEPDGPNFAAVSDDQAGDPDDAEDDDPSGMDDEDGVNTAVQGGAQFWNNAGPGCPLFDSDHSY